MNLQRCDPDRLDAFVRAELNEQQECELTAHLDQCESCGGELERRVAASDEWREASELLTHHESGSRRIDDSGDKLSGIADCEAAVDDRQMEHVVGMLAPTDDPEMLGRIGGYEVSGVIGSGGMGVVFKAHDRSLDRVVAIKVMAPHLAGSGAARKRFARESKAAAAVLHPNVIAIHSVADDPKLPYLVMPYIGGTSLQKRIEADGPLCPQDTLRIGQQIAAGLAAAHAQGLVHRDIKPANILLERGVERVTITDFGLARAVDDATMTRSGVIAGTPQYMSPEQARGETIDHRSDLFSLGSVLYAMCTGHSPFRSESTFGILRRITDNEPRPIRDINPDVPEWLCAIIEKLHAKDASERFQSAEEVAELLEDCLAHVQQPTSTPLPNAVADLAKCIVSHGSTTATESLGGFRYPPIGKLIAAAAFTFSLFFAGVFILLELNKGTLTIESEADNVPVRILQGDHVVKELTVSKEGKSTRIAAGQYVVELGADFDNVVVGDGTVTLKSRDSATIRIALSDRERVSTVNYNVSGVLAKDSMQTVEQQLDSLVQLVMEKIAPESWDDREFVVEPYPARENLVVRQTASRHKAIAELFDSLPMTFLKPARDQMIGALVTVESSVVSDDSMVHYTGMGWIVDADGHILFLSPGVTEEKIEVRYANGVRCGAQSIDTHGHFALIKASETNGARPIALNAESTLQDGDPVLAILNATDVSRGAVTKARKTIVISEGPGWSIQPPLRFPNVITTDFRPDAATLSGAPLLTQNGDVAGMLMKYGNRELFAIPLAEIQTACRQLGVIAEQSTQPNSDVAPFDGRRGPTKSLDEQKVSDTMNQGRNLLGNWEVLSISGTAGTFMTLDASTQVGDRLIIPHIRVPRTSQLDRKGGHVKAPSETLWISKKIQEDWSRRDSLHAYAYPIGSSACVGRVTYQSDGGLTNHFSNPKRPPEFAVFQLENDQLTLAIGDPTDFKVEEGQSSNQDSRDRPVHWKWRLVIPNYPSDFELQSDERKLIVKLRRIGALTERSINEDTADQERAKERVSDSLKHTQPSRSTHFETPDALMKYAVDCQKRGDTEGCLACWTDETAKQFATSYLMTATIILQLFESSPTASRSPDVANQAKELKRLIDKELDNPEAKATLAALVQATKKLAKNAGSDLEDIASAATKSKLVQMLAVATAQRLEDPRRFIVRFIALDESADAAQELKRDDYGYTIDQAGETATAIFKSDGEEIGLIKTPTGWLIYNPAGREQGAVMTVTQTADTLVHLIQGKPVVTQKATVTKANKSTRTVSGKYKILIPAKGEPAIEAMRK